MTRVEKQRICDKIFKYITEELTEWVDIEIFNKTSIEQLGEFYYNHILSAVEDSSSELLNAVIQTIAPRDIEYKCAEEYYRGLCRILHILKLPYAMLIDVQREYDEIFVQKYNSVIQKYQLEVDKINYELRQLKFAGDAIKNAKPSFSFVRDLSTDELRLYELDSECNALRTRKEMLDFAIGYLTSKLMEFCNIEDATSVDNSKMREALKLSKEDVYGANFAFSSYRDYVEIIEDDIERPYALFFKVKLYVIIENARKKYHYSSYTKSNDEAIDEYKDYLSLIPKINDLNSYKNSNANSYNAALEKMITDYGLVEELKNRLESSVCLRKRKHILLKAVDLYTQGEFEIFNNILPIQIEGMFADYLRDTTTFLRFTKMDIYSNATLKDKIRYLHDIKSDIYPEAVEYFMYYFNNMIRNKIAHGRYKWNSDECIQDAIFSRELILDMCMLVHMLSRKSETEEMYRFIHGYQAHYRRVIRSSEHPCFGALFNDMVGDKLISDYDTVKKYRPIQVAYWLVNPYYEKIYEQIEDKTDLLELRAEFLSKEFWDYVLERLNDITQREFDYKNINMEFRSVVNGLFRCNISDEVKQLLAKVNAALSKIQTLQRET